MINLTRRALLAGLASAAAAGTARAREWPERPVTWVLPYPPGGSTDTFSRPIAAHVGKRLGQAMVMENLSGAGGTIGAAAVARAAPDGYTVMTGDTGHCFASIVYPRSGFDLARDFAPIAAIARMSAVLVVNPARLNVTTLAQFLDAARARPGAINIASPGLGTIPHLAIENLQHRSGIKLNHVPYRGAGPAMLDLLSGQVDVMFTPLVVAAGHVNAGKLRALAIAGRRPESLLPNVPTFDAVGVSDFRATTWLGIFAPIRTPEPILDRMHAALQAALAEDDVKRIWAEHGARVELESRADFQRFVTSEIERWTRAARAANVQLD
jgi:tripartite-type tricarboxylate transporter receptor subunit TctC